MPNTITTNTEEGIIDVKFFGITTKSEVDEFLVKLLQIKEETSIDKVLVDTSELVQTPNTIEILQLVSTFPRDMKFATWLNKGQSTEQDIRFGETVAVNRNIAIKIFTSKEDALNWLLR